jgi:hypothetical protein
MSWVSQAFGDILGRLLNLNVDLNGCLPQYDPARWNDGNGIQYHNNCYNYACDTVTGTYAWPGRGSGHPFSVPSCAGVSAGAQGDGLVATTAGESCGCGGCWFKVALVFWSGPYSEDDGGYLWDFHFYRQDSDGTWSHKPGGNPATNLDQSGNPITDPQTADRGKYTEFCGFFCVRKDSITIK